MGLINENSSAGPIAVAEHGEGQSDPHGGMRVLTAVLTQSRRIGLDVAGVVRRAVERRGEELHQALAAAHELRVDRGHRACRALAGRRRRKSPPTIARSNRCGIHRSPPIPRACRRRNSRGDTSLRPRLRGRSRAAARSACLRQAATLAVSPRRSAIGGEPHQCGVQKPAEPDALAATFAMPTRFMPSFQSPAPNSGKPCEPMARLESSASAQCWYKDAVAAGFGAPNSSCWSSASGPPSRKVMGSSSIAKSSVTSR